jgi:hypothetical protein
VSGNLTAYGTTTFAGTLYSNTSALSVVNFGPGAALFVGQSGLGDIASFYDLDQNIEVLHVGGNNGTFPNVGIKTSTPNKTLTVNGEISASGKIWGDGTGLTLPAPTAGTLGGVKAGTNITIAADGTISGSAPYTLPVATASVLGGVKQGTNITISGDGTISGSAPYTLPVATTTVLGGVKQGTNITIDAGGVISSPVAASHTHAWADISSKPNFSTVATSGSYADLSNKPSFSAVATSGSYADLSNRPNFSTVATSGSYTDLTGRPNFSAVATSGSYSDLSSKPTLGTAAAKDIPTTGDATTTQVVMGNDTRLSNGRAPTGNASGDLTGTYPSPTLVTANNNVGVFGSATQVPKITVDGKGRVTAVEHVNITASSSTSVTVSPQAGTSYTISLTDAGRLITFSNSSSITFNVPTDSSVAFPVGTQLMISQIGTGQVTVVAVTPGTTTVNGNNGTKTAGRYAIISLIKIAENAWIIGGDATI